MSDFENESLLLNLSFVTLYDCCSFPAHSLFITQIVKGSLHDLYCTVQSVQYTVYSSQCTIHSAQFTVYNTQLTVNSVQYTVHGEQYTVPYINNSAQCIGLIVHCMIHSIQFKVQCFENSTLMLRLYILKCMCIVSSVQ